MSAQEREALAETLAREEWPDLTWSYIREHSDPERFYRRADALLAAGWTRPVPGGDAIERVRQLFALYGVGPGQSSDLVKKFTSRGLLVGGASPVREPGRSEAEIKAEGAREALRSAARDVIASPSTRLGDTHPGEVWARWLNSCADQVADTEGSKT